MAENDYALNFPVSVDGLKASTRSEHPVLLNLRDKAYALDKTPLSEKSGYTRAYIHHLLNTHELLATVLLCAHNIHHYAAFFAEIRRMVELDKFEEYVDAFFEYAERR